MKDVGWLEEKATDVFQVGWLLGNDEHKMNLEIFFTLQFFGNSLIRGDIGSFLHIW